MLERFNPLEQSGESSDLDRWKHAEQTMLDGELVAQNLLIAEASAVRRKRCWKMGARTKRKKKK